MSGISSAEIWYLDNSGFAVKTENHLFIFDYWNEKPFDKGRGLNAGTIEPEEIRGLNVVVFASHAHRDHYIPAILNWEREIPNIRYVLSHDIPSAANCEHVTVAYPNETIDLEDVQIKTLKSTDEGVSFLVRADGLNVYHAGDLNWWHWEGEPDVENEEMARDYEEQIDLIRGEQIDIAFIPVDPRLKEQYLWGLDYFMRSTDTKTVFPMHFWGKYSIFDRLENDPDTAGYRSRIVRISRRGEHFLIDHD